MEFGKLTRKLNKVDKSLPFSITFKNQRAMFHSYSFYMCLSKKRCEFMFVKQLRSIHGELLCIGRLIDQCKSMENCLSKAALITSFDRVVSCTINSL